MQLLNIPAGFDAMKASMSLTGITILKDGRYNQRHDLPNRIKQVPLKGLQLSVKKKSAPVEKKPYKSALNFPVPEKIKKERLKRLYFVDKKQVSHRIKNYVLAMPGEKLLYFWTVSFPINTSDNVAYILMNKWLTRLRFENKIGSYLWVAERQVNGTIHFHIVLNRRMNVARANKYMRASIMHCINDGSIAYDRIQAMRYNGVDIAKDRNTKKVVNFALNKKQRSLARYLTKYVTKNNIGFDRLAWHCSREYSNLCIAVRVSESEWITTNTKFFISDKPIFENEWASFYPWLRDTPPDFLNYISSLNSTILQGFN